MKIPLLTTNLFLLFAVAATAQTTHNVSMTSGNVYVPANISINKNDIVTWTNDGSVPHTSTSGPDCTSDGLWDSGTINAGGTFSHTFSTTGTFPYHCTFHCNLGMVGQITVTDVGINGTRAAQEIDLHLKSFPNPFSETASLEFELTEGANVTVNLYDMLGKKITTPLESILSSGKHTIDISGIDLKEGLYVCKLFVNYLPAGSTYLVKSKNN